MTFRLGMFGSNVRTSMGIYGAPTDYGVAKVVNEVTILIGWLWKTLDG